MEPCGYQLCESKGVSCLKTYLIETTFQHIVPAHQNSEAILFMDKDSLQIGNCHVPKNDP